MEDTSNFPKKDRMLWGKLSSVEVLGDQDTIACWSL